MGTEQTTIKLDRFFRNFLDIEGFASIDRAQNGIQVDNDGSVIQKIAFGVDAAMETFERAADINAGMVFVHHGLFWDVPVLMTGNNRQRIKFLLDHNIALYAVHLPLDQHPKFGNNAVITDLLGLENIESFGLYKGRKIGYKGDFSKPVTIDEVIKKINFMNRPPLGIFPFGKKVNTNAAVLSGGCAQDARQAMKEGVDLFVTGESSHQIYHDCLEGKLNMIAAGHYNTEVWGLQAVMKYCRTDLGIETEFIDVPTGL
ncbi:MAG: Nif3-like dinuclear metal center hexameric protein [Bacteroidales bacterium]|jgi:dinuclear metal center YbgI/SA1388 family protein|nr:Nif3-like dinuclear metal center hexameric protein [Bacteroidales bacterium]